MLAAFAFRTTVIMIIPATCKASAHIAIRPYHNQFGTLCGYQNVIFISLYIVYWNFTSHLLHRRPNSIVTPVKLQNDWTVLNSNATVLSIFLDIMLEIFTLCLRDTSSFTIKNNRTTIPCKVVLLTDHVIQISTSTSRDKSKHVLNKDVEGSQNPRKGCPVTFNIRAFLEHGLISS